MIKAINITICREEANKTDVEGTNVVTSHLNNGQPTAGDHITGTFRGGRK